MEFNVRQKKVINAEEPKILCLSSAASGKTRVLTERVRVLIEEKGVPAKEIVAITFTNLAADEMRKRLGSIAEGMYIGTIHAYAARICYENNINVQHFIDTEYFDKILDKALTISRSRYPKVRHLLIDECQDLNDLNYKFIDKIPAENVFFVGDEKQCQPAGTKIKLRNGIVKNIEDIRIGDSVVWYDNKKSYLSGVNIKGNSIEKKVTAISKREFVNDNLITITTENGHITKYTPNHIGFVKLNKNEYNHAVYLMCDENYRFRIGKIPFTSDSSNGTPWRDKMYAEGCSKIWILKVFKTDKEARVLETKLSYKYQIPQTCWQLDKVKWTEEDLNYIYDGLDTKKGAISCLKEFGRDINYPLLDKNMEKFEHIHFAKNAVTQIYASNIMSEVMDVIVYDINQKHRKRYEKIVSVKYAFIKEPIYVYSLAVEGETYVADEIVTHNCIYQFRGASEKELLLRYNDPTYKKYYLIDNYRNAPSIVEFAEDFLASSRHLSPLSNPVKKKRGTVVECSFREAVEELEYSGNWGSWFILGRTNAQIQEAQRILNEKGIPNISFKKGDFDLDELTELMASDKVKVLTIHTAKGLENKNVIVTGAKLYNEEERRIAYVAATRAENSLYWCPAIVSPRKQVNKKGNIFAQGNTKIIEF